MSNNTVKQAPASRLARNKTPARKKIPLFYIILLSVVALAACAVIIANLYIRTLLTDYESAQPKYEAERLFQQYFGSPNFEALIDKSGYTLQDGETLENAVAYFTDLTAGGDLSYIRVTSAFEEQADALVYMVKSNGVNIAKMTLVPSGEETKHGNALYTEGGIMLIRRNRPTPTPAPTPEPTPVTTTEPTPPPTDEPVQYSDKLQRQYSTYVLDAIKTLSLRFRNSATKGEALAYYEPGSEIYNRIDDTDVEHNLVYHNYEFSDEIADEFVELDSGAFSCRVRFSLRMSRTGRPSITEDVDYTLYLRPSEKGKPLIYEQFVTVAAPGEDT